MADIILNADLYDNAITERKGDYTARPRLTGTLRNADIARRIVAKRTEYRPETIENILNLADQEKVTAIAEGKSLVDGVGQYLINISGSFEGEKAPFDPSLHKLSVSYTPGKLLRSTLKEVRVQTSTASTGPIVNEITDATTGEKNLLLTSGGPAVIDGANLKITGDSSTIGVFFTPQTGTALKAPLVIHNNPSQLTITMPQLADGEYTLSITTQYASGSRMTKEPRTFRFPVILTVGELPDPDDDHPVIE